MKKLLGILATLALAGNSQAAQTTYDISGEMIGSENLCFPITVVFTIRDCSYGDTRAEQTGVFDPDNWLGPTGGSSFYAQGGIEDDPSNYIPTSGDNRINVPLTGTWTIDDQNTSDPSDDAFSAVFVLGQAIRNVATGQSTRAVERWTSITHMLAPTLVDSAIGNANGGVDYTIAFNGVFPTIISSAADPTDTFPTPEQIEANPQQTFQFWTTPNSSLGVGIERSNFFAPNQTNIPAPPFPTGPAFPAATTTALFDGYSCDDINTVDCPSDDAQAGQLVDGSILLWGGLEDPGFDNFIVRVSTNDRGQITDAEAIWTQEFLLFQGITNGIDNNGWFGGRIVFAGQDPTFDWDGDGVPDASDNCINVANGPDAGGNNQVDADNDGFGNVCDADFNNDGIVNAGDLGYFRMNFGTNDAVADLNVSGFVNFGDLGLLRQLFGQPPGPSGAVP